MQVVAVEHWGFGRSGTNYNSENDKVKGRAPQSQGPLQRCRHYSFSGRTRPGGEQKCRAAREGRLCTFSQAVTLRTLQRAHSMRDLLQIRFR